MLDIRTYDAAHGGNALYKALAHPLAAEGLAALAGRLSASGPFAVYDPEGFARMLFALHPELVPDAGVFVHDIDRVGEVIAGAAPARALTELPQADAATVLIASFDDGRMLPRVRPLLPNGAALETLTAARIPDAMLSVPRAYLDRLNFATNYAFFRDADGLSTRLVTANYWANYDAPAVQLWLRLFDEAGAVLCTWEQSVPTGPAGIVIDSAQVRARFGLGAFTGQLFVHAIGVRGHDVVKYALETYGNDGNPSLSVTHDANAWPSDRYANLPAPAPGEHVVLWLQNSHARPIVPGDLALNRMGTDEQVPVPVGIGPYATLALDVGALVPDLAWPAQIEVRTGRHVVRPRYEITADRRTRIAHLNVERNDLRPEPAIRALPEAAFGRGFLLPFPILDPKRYRSIVLPAPMSEALETLPVRIDCFDADGRPTASRFLGCLPRNHAEAPDMADWVDEAGHGELVYDFRDGGDADGWLHTLVRYHDRHSGHAAESSFGAHIFNTLMTWRSEPQSYSGPAPGLTTRLFLKLGRPDADSFAWLIYPVSRNWHAFSDTGLTLHDGSGAEIAQATLKIPASGSRMVRPGTLFGHAALARAGEDGYVLIRDLTCRLFGYHGVMDDGGRFSLDHMFGF
ncbi:hypothetical protein AA103196_3086 [Ameyamaea chiangmaiensis NBRC 103196]|uniref:Uncharacterized protein n=1 Tax=Ameyamaea chiangmaiensis TaxID=442969 RepID=A0A850P3U4_9PROT|nr:hypothetical protein [Ameyamaea chiangmaiensis]MBS4074571.1 hypothetical protein [Ameyamaea chiangmaiensis]NVN39327.1 hypothetical protein [Ameyamaea chiangmaiensis]GBQ72524.1 hypothetical protein AA103196_3086 [Ameyamaea chiangmaiensis NBRC 103196]